ncbi:MAG: Gfo/Idh/MocA family protein [Flavobacteriaceae bacterium]
MSTKLIKIGVFGAGHLGKIHLKLLNESKIFKLIGFFDVNTEHSVKIEKEFGYKYFNDSNHLLESVDAIAIITPTKFHYEIAIKCIEKNKHIFIEKPITYTVEQAEKIVKFSKEKKIIGQVGHVERFNPAFNSIKKIIGNPMFIESHRLSEFNPRGTDVSVVLDLMIHDIDIVLSLISSKVKNITSSGVSVISDTPDIANARIEFQNGAVANLTASRISLKNMRKLRFFQRETYISVDLYNKKVEVVKMIDAPKKLDEFALTLENAEGKKKQILFDSPKVSNHNAILLELENFADSIINGKKPIVTLEDGMDALKIAYSIINLM